MGVTLGWCLARSSKPFERQETVSDEFDSHTLPPPFVTGIMTRMALQIRRKFVVFAGPLAVVLMITANARPATAAQPASIGQHRINELAGSLLRAYRALVEEPGLRRDGERLEPYMERIAAPLPGEPAGRYEARESAYIAALERAEAREQICTTVPILRDTSAANAAAWKKAANASAVIPARVTAVRELWSAQKGHQPSAAAARKLGLRMAQAILVIKLAYDALREARP